jgi:hypothetical protein
LASYTSSIDEVVNGAEEFDFNYIRLLTFENDTRNGKRARTDGDINAASVATQVDPVFPTSTHPDSSVELGNVFYDCSAQFAKSVMQNKWQTCQGCSNWVCYMCAGFQFVETDFYCDECAN